MIQVLPTEDSSSTWADGAKKVRKRDSMLSSDQSFGVVAKIGHFQGGRIDLGILSQKLDIIDFLLTLWEYKFDMLPPSRLLNYCNCSK